MSPVQRGKPSPSEYDGVKGILTTTFRDYTPLWSLADKKYSGTCTLVHKRLEWHTDGKEWNSFVAFSLASATDLMLKRYGVTREQVGLPVRAKKKSEPTAKLRFEKPQPKQTSMTSFFSIKPKTTSSTASISSCGDHHREGRIQIFCLDEMDIVQTYVPNNGSNDGSFARRRQWDEDICKFLNDRRRILDYVQEKHIAECTSRSILWCGDLNVAKEHIDGTHWQERETQHGKEIYEWWTDEPKCSVKYQRDSGKSAENVGMPSFTPAERVRFRKTLEEADLVDVWRQLHPNGQDLEESQKLLRRWEQPNFTWRGHLGKNGAPSKYQGKGQRLDYFLLAPSRNISAVKVCRILGHGERRDGLFCGSDHCATILKLK